MQTTREPQTTRPALDKLAADQTALLYGPCEIGGEDRDLSPLVEPFGSWWDVLAWVQATTVRTLGQLTREIPPEEWQPQSTLRDGLFSTKPWASHTRQRLAERVGRSCRRSFRDLSRDADERLEEADGDDYRRVDPDEDVNPAMRPALKELDHAQATVIRELWTGFVDRRALSRWCRRVEPATHGLAAEDLQDRLARSPALLEFLIERDDRTATMQRYRFAVGELLPAFAKAARTLRAGETHETAADSDPWNEV